MTIEARFCFELGDFRLDVDLQLPGRGVTSLFGPSGCGKTSLLRAIAGLDRHIEGRLRLGELLWQDAGTFVPPHRRAIGYVFQEASLFDHLSVAGNLAYGLKRVPAHERAISLERAVTLLGPAGSGRTFLCEMLAHGGGLHVFRIEPELLFGERLLIALCRQYGMDINPNASMRFFVEAFLSQALPPE